MCLIWENLLESRLKGKTYNKRQVFCVYKNLDPRGHWWSAKLYCYILNYDFFFSNIMGSKATVMTIQSQITCGTSMDLGNESCLGYQCPDDRGVI